MYNFANTATDGLEDILVRLDSVKEELETLLYGAKNTSEPKQEEIYELNEKLLFLEGTRQSIQSTLNSLLQFNKESGV